MDLIDIRQLSAFQHLAQTGSFTEAAKRLFLTQSAVSHSVKALENSVGCRLLERGGKKLTLTMAGEALLLRADRILGEMQRATTEMEALSKWGFGRLRIGATNTMCEYLIPPAIRGLREQMPNAIISVQAADSPDLMVLLEDGEIDIAVGMAIRGGEAGVHFRPLFKDRLVFVVSPDHPWAEKGIASEDELQGQSYIIYSRKSSTFRLIERGFHRLGIRLSSTMELGNMEAIKNLAKIGLGVGLVSPWLAAEDVASGSLVEVEIPGETVEREWGLYTRKTVGGAGLAGESFASMCRKVAADLGCR